MAQYERSKRTLSLVVGGIASGIFFSLLLATLIAPQAVAKWSASKSTAVSNEAPPQESTPVNGFAAASSDTEASHQGSNSHQTCPPEAQCSLSQVDTPRCRPKVFVLASFPTSGNGFFQQVMLATSEVHILRYYEGECKGPCNPVKFPQSQLPYHIPMKSKPFGLPSLMKTHFPRSWAGELQKDKPDKAKALAQWTNAVKHDVTGLIHLARNPGDQLLRNFMRWRMQGKVKKLCGKGTGTGGGVNNCYDEIAKKHCHEIFLQHPGWSTFHQWWFDHFEPSKPSIIVQYERMSSKATVQAELLRTIKVMGLDKCEHDAALGERKVREPTYETGTLFASACGVAMARRLHAKTAKVSKRLGYNFDQDTGYWSAA